MEGTCESGKDFSFPNEIIVSPPSQGARDNTCLTEQTAQEFPVVLVKWVSQASAENGMELVVVDSFQSYVKPVWRSRLSTFATSLTGITQARTFSLFSVSLLVWQLTFAGLIRPPSMTARHLSRCSPPSGSS